MTGDRTAGTDFVTILKNQSKPVVATAPGTLGAVTPSLPPPSIPVAALTAPATQAITVANGPMFVSDPIGTGPTLDALGLPVGTHYNPTLFATDAAAAAMAEQLGGAVYKAPLREAGGGTLNSPFTMPDANYIKMPNGAIVNAGTIVQWASIGRSDLIRNEISTPAATNGAGEDSWYKQFPGPNMQNALTRT